MNLIWKYGQYLTQNQHLQKNDPGISGTMPKKSEKWTLTYHASLTPKQTKSNTRQKKEK